MANVRRNYSLEFIAVCFAFYLGSCGDNSNNPPPNGSVHIPSGAVAWLRAEGVATDDIAGRQAVLLGQNCYGPGKVATGFRFSGLGTTCMLSDTSSLDMRSSVSLLCWTKLDTPLAQQPAFAYYSNYPSLVAKGNGAYTKRNYGIYFDKSGDALYFNGIDELETNYVFSVMLTTAGQHFADLGWHLVGAVWNRTEKKAYIYIDGQVVASANGLDANLAINDFPLMIGAGYSDENFIKASLDEIMVFSRALSTSEIQTVFNAGSVGCIR
jgi:hypothetical protein